MLKCSPQRQHIPVVMISALGPSGLSRALEYGAADYLNKPLDAADLLTRLQRAIAAPSTQTPAADPRQ